MLLQEALGILIGPPDRGQAGCLGGHNIHAVAVVGGHVGDSGAYKLHHLVLYIAVLEYGADDGQGDILGTNVGSGLSVQIDGDHIRTCHIVCISQQLFYQLAAALSDGHGAQSAVTGMAVRAKDHLAAAGHHLTHILMDHCDVRGNIDSAVLLGSGQAEHVVVLIDGPSYGTQGVVAVGQHIGNGELLHAGSLCRLNDPHEGDVMGSHGVKPDLQMFHIAGYVVGLHNGIGHGSLPVLGFIGLLSG